jgi:hypothetical protein
MQNAPHTFNDLANQAPRFENINLFSSDRVLVETIAREGTGIEPARLQEFGAAMGSAEMWEMAAAMQRHVPELHAFDCYAVTLCTPCWNICWRKSSLRSVVRLP